MVINSGKRIKENLEKICQKEISDKALKIYLLPDNESIEDILCNPKYLRESIGELFQQLLDQNIREKAGWY